MAALYQKTEAEKIAHIANVVDQTIATGDMAEIEGIGALLVHLIQEPGCAIPNVIAAAVEVLRSEWTRLYRAEVEAAKVSISGVQVSSTGQFMVSREDRAEVAAKNREKLENRFAKPEVKSAPQGTFTVEHEGSDVYETIKIKTYDEGNMAGKTIASFISGPDNENSFTGFAFVTPEGQIKVWSRFANIDRRWIEAVEIVLAGDSGEAREAYAIRSGRCSICGRKLTVPASLHKGMGPDCAEKYGF